MADNHEAIVTQSFTRTLIRPLWVSLVASVLVSFPALLLAAVPDVPTTQTRTSKFEYDATTGLLVKEVVEPTDPNQCVANVYLHDEWGNRKSVTTRNCNGSAGESAAPAAGSVALFTARTTTTVYDSIGRFPVTVTNAANQTETHGYDARFGLPNLLRGPNQLQTTWQYDGFGRKTLESRADGTSSTWSYQECWDLTSCQARYTIVATTSGAPTVTKRLDIFGREVVQLVSSFSGAAWREEKGYDARGRVVRQTRPFLDGSGNKSAPTTTIEYDLLNRVTRVLDPIPRTGEAQPITRTIYEGLRTTVIDPRGYNKIVTRNAAGQQERIVDHKGGTVRYGYDAFGNLIGTDANGVFTVVKYDLRGRKIEMDDPHMGIWRYENDAIGQLKKQTNAKGQITTLTYDLLGRMTQRLEPDLTSNWEYDTNRSECANANGKAIGKLSRASTTAGYGRIHCYDNLSRASSERTTIGTETFVSSMTYDAFSRVDVTTYPTGYQVRNTYQNGYLRQVVQVAGGTVLWQANSMNPNGQLLTEALGNGVATTRDYDNLGRIRSVGAGASNAVQNNTFGYDAVGNLTGRTWAISGVTSSETFTYDELNRLSSVTGVNGPPNKTYTYDAIGNFVTKSGVGTYQYHAGSHKLNLIQGTVNGITNPSFIFDPNGNLSSGAGYTTTWSSFDKPTRIQKTGGAITSDFNYGPEHQRIRQIAGSVTTLYFGAYERDTNASGLVEHKHLISARGALIAQYTTRSSGAPEMRYLHRDHLGSVVAVTNEAGAVVVRYSYDAWGQRRNPNGADQVITTAAFDRGYTGHEMLDSLRLVHMNGRVYDPLVGRFVSADPFVPDANDLQAYNRFAYVENNPLTLNDPSGYFSLSKFFAAPLKLAFKLDYALPWHRPVLHYVANSQFLSSVAIAVAAYYGFGYGGAVASAHITWLRGGSDGDLLRAGAISLATAWAFQGAGQIGATYGEAAGYAAHAAIGCASAEAQGGKCGQGAAAQFVSKFATNNISGSVEYEFVASVVAGGTVSAISGGKFANGALTAAFGYIFNALSQDEFEKLSSHLKGIEGESATREAILKAGYRIVGEQVGVNTIADKGVIDFLVQTHKGNFVAIEAKAGRFSKLSPNQIRYAPEVDRGIFFLTDADQARAMGLDINQPRGGIDVRRWGGYVINETYMSRAAHIQSGRRFNQLFRGSAQGVLGNLFGND